MKKRNRLSLFFFLSYLLSNSSLHANMPPHANTHPTSYENRDSDMLLSRQVKAAILKVKSLANHLISVNSHEGVITLEGTVNKKSEEKDALRAAKTVKGVVAIKSQITIQNAYLKNFHEKNRYH